MPRKQGYRWFRDWRPNQRERSVLDALSEGRTNTEIADLLGITLDGAKWHVSKLFDKTGLSDREALAEWWRSNRDQQQRAFVLPWLPFHRDVSSVGVLGGVAVAITAVAVWLYLGQSGREQAPQTQPLAGIEIGVDGPAQPERIDDQKIWTQLESRPLELPPLAPDGSCPVSGLSPLGQGQVLGQGPVHPVRGPLVLLGELTGARDSNGWYPLKTLWLATGNYDGIALIRGGQIDGDGQIRFQQGSGTPSEPFLRIERQSTAWGPGYGVDTRQYPSLTQINAPGCYAWQVDGENFSYHVVFSAQEEPAATVSDWTKARFLNRNADLLLVSVDGEPWMARIDLNRVEAFDCRVDCLVDAGSLLQPLTPSDELCIGYLHTRTGNQEGRIWVSRDSCEATDRATAP